MTYQGDSLDYRVSWTVQFWARLDGASGVDQWLLSDIDCTRQIGVAVRYDNPTPAVQSVVLEMAYPDPDADYCSGQPVHHVRIPAPTDQEWHFYRMSRAGQFSAPTVTICVDGTRAGEFPARYNSPASAVPTLLELGKRTGFSGSFSGQLADLAVYSQGLPCP